MKRFIEGEVRLQATLLLDYLEDYVSDENPGRLMPDFKTIAGFRRKNGSAICAVCTQFVTLCRRLNLFTKARAVELRRLTSTAILTLKVDSDAADFPCHEASGVTIANGT
jgi:hypothetical protein